MRGVYDTEKLNVDPVPRPDVVVAGAAVKVMVAEPLDPVGVMTSAYGFCVTLTPNFELVDDALSTGEPGTALLVSGFPSMSLIVTLNWTADALLSVKPAPTLPLTPELGGVTAIAPGLASSVIAKPAVGGPLTAPWTIVTVVVCCEMR